MPDTTLLPPEAGIFDNPAYLLFVNADWWSHISGQIGNLRYADQWDGTEDQVYRATQSIFRLLDVAPPHAYNIFGDSEPIVSDNPDETPVNLGVKFQVGVTGEIVGLRFWKSAANTGTHTGYLFESDGTPLGSLTFADETASGWQSGYFATPIALNPFVTYVASYFAPVGHYASDHFSFGADVVNVLLRAMKSLDTDSNGVYSYDVEGAFPFNSYESTNYWIDVIFRPTGD